MSKWYLINTDGSVVLKPWTKTPALHELQHAVDGFVEHVTLDGRTFLWANEDGFGRGFAVNNVATIIYQHFYGPEVGIVGPCLLEIRGATKRNKLITEALLAAAADEHSKVV